MSQSKLVLSTETGKNWPASIENIVKSLRLNPSSAFNASVHWWHLHLILVFFPLHSGVRGPLIQEVGRENITGRKTQYCQILCWGKTTEKQKHVWAVGCLWGRKRNSEFECKCRVIRRCDYSFYWESFTHRKEYFHICPHHIYIHTYHHHHYHCYHQIYQSGLESVSYMESEVKVLVI